MVTGGTGFIGSHTVDEFLRRGFHVRCLVRPSRKNLGWLTGLPVEIIPVNLSDTQSLPNALRNADYVVHIAGTTRARRRRDFFYGNADLTLALLDSARRAGTIRQFCYMSSLTAVGPSSDGTLLNETAKCRPITPYGQSKLEAEKLCRQFQNDISVVILRPPAVYGPRDKDILHMFRWINLGLMPVLGSKHKTLSLAYAPDLAKATVLATVSHRASGETYFVGDEKPYEYSALVDIAAGLLKKKAIRIPLPRPLVYAIAAATQATSWVLPNPSVVNIDKVKDLMSTYWVCDSGKIGRELGFSTENGAEKGLSLTLEWYRKNRLL